MGQHRTGKVRCCTQFLPPPCLWTDETNREAVANIVEEAVKATGFDSGENIAELDREKEELDQEIHQELYHSENVYKNKTVNNNEYFEHTVHFVRQGRTFDTKTFLIPAKKLKSTAKFNPVDSNGNPLKDIECVFDKQGACNIAIPSGPYGSYDKIKPFTPTVLLHKGDRKENVNSRLIKELSNSGRRQKLSATPDLSGTVLPYVLFRTQR